MAATRIFSHLTVLWPTQRKGAAIKEGFQLSHCRTRGEEFLFHEKMMLMSFHLQRKVYQHNKRRKHFEVIFVWYGEFKCIHHHVLFLYRYITISFCLVYVFTFEIIIHYFKQNPQNQKQQLSRSSSLPARWNLVIPSKPRTGTPKKAAMAESSAQPQKIWWKSLKIGTWGCDSHDVFFGFSTTFEVEVVAHFEKRYGLVILDDGKTFKKQKKK